jgi:hypothetical protein
MEPIRRGDVNHIHLRRSKQLAVITKGLWNAKAISRRAHAIRQIAQGDDRHAKATEGFEMNGADEASANDTGANLAN